LVGGWQTQGIAGYRSGLPFTPTISTDVANIGFLSASTYATSAPGQRPNRIGSGTLPDPTPTMWFDKTAFKVPSAYTFGNSGAYILRARPVRFLDMSLFKEFVPTEKTRVQFRLARGVQPYQYTEFQSAKLSHRYCGGRQGDQHFQQPTATAACAKTTVLNGLCGAAGCLAERSSAACGGPLTGGGLCVQYVRPAYGQNI
jgi:hypothetical protein